MVTWLSHFGPVVSQNIMAGAHGGAKLLTFWRPGSRESQGMREKGQGLQYPLQAITSVTCFLQQGPATSQEHHQLGNKPSTYEL
jgi:hypothetical protein